MDAITISFICYLIMILIVGIYTSTLTKNLKDFSLGGHRLGPTVIAFSERASGESAWLILGLPAAAHGVPQIPHRATLPLVTGLIQTRP